MHGKAAALADPPAGSDLEPVMGEPGLPGIGKTLSFMRRGPELTLEQYDKFGPVSWTTILGMKVVTVVGPEACQAVLVNKDKTFSQNGWEWFIGPFFKRGLMLLDGDEHHYHRRIMQEAFTRPRLESYVRQLDRDHRRDRSRSGRPTSRVPALPRAQGPLARGRDRGVHGGRTRLGRRGDAHAGGHVVRRLRARRAVD